MNRPGEPDSPAISVIIPVYNVEKFLHACVDSVLAQTFRDYEIILVNDGATKRCPAICDAYAKEYAQVQVIHQENAGLSAARNTGFAAARGKYVYFLDSDDWIVPSALNTLYQIAESKQADAVFFEASVIDESGRPIYHPDYTSFYSRTAEYSDCRPGKQLFREMLQNGDYLPAAPMIFIRREAMKYTFTPILHEDELFTPRLLYSIDRACTCCEALYVRRVRSASITTEPKSHRHFAGMATAARELLAFPDADATLRRYAYGLALSAASIYQRISVADRKTAKPEMLKLIQSMREQHDLRARLQTVLLNVPTLYGAIRTLRRWIPKWAFRLRAYIQNRKRFRPELEKISSASAQTRRIFLIGSPEHGNLGDHAIAKAERKFFSDHVPEAAVFNICMPFYRAYRHEIGKLARKSDLIAVSGGGWLGNVWYHNEKIVFDIIRRFRENRVIIFPQTIFYQPSRKTARQMARAKRMYAAHHNLTLFLREKNSLALAKTLCPDARYSPDMCLYLDERKPRAREGVLLCFRQDREKMLDDAAIRTIEDHLLAQGVIFRQMTTVLEKTITTARSELALEKKLEEFRKARLVITDRLHAALFCAVTGTPCIAFDNLTNKVSGVLAEHGTQCGIFIASDEKEAIQLTQNLLSNALGDVNHAPSFDVLADLWRKEFGQN